MSRYTQPLRIAANADVNLEYRDPTPSEEDAAALKAAGDFFRTWKVSVSIKTTLRTRIDETETYLSKSLGTKEATIEAIVAVNARKGNNEDDTPVFWKVSSYRDRSADRVYSDGPDKSSGLCRNLVEAHRLIADRIATLKTIPVPSPAECAEQKRRTEEEEKAARQAYRDEWAAYEAETPIGTGEAA